MSNDSTIHVGLDVHKESIMATYSISLGEVQSLGNIGVLQRDIDRLCTRRQSKVRTCRSCMRPGRAGRLRITVT